MPALDRENMQALVDAIDTRDHARAVQLARELSASCDSSGVLRQWLSVAPLLDAVAELLAGNAGTKIATADQLGGPNRCEWCATDGTIRLGPACVAHCHACGQDYDAAR